MAPKVRDKKRHPSTSPTDIGKVSTAANKVEDDDLAADTSQNDFDDDPTPSKSEAKAATTGKAQSARKEKLGARPRAGRRQVASEGMKRADILTGAPRFISNLTPVDVVLTKSLVESQRFNAIVSSVDNTSPPAD